MLLRETQDGVDDQERTHHREIGIFPQDQRQHHNQFEHPRRQAPELREKCADRMAFLHGHFVVALRLLTGGGLGAGKPGFRVHMQRREGVGYGRGCDVRRLRHLSPASRAGVRRRNPFWSTASDHPSPPPIRLYAPVCAIAEFPSTLKIRQGREQFEPLAPTTAPRFCARDGSRDIVARMSNRGASMSFNLRRWRSNLRLASGLVLLVLRHLPSDGAQPAADLARPRRGRRSKF